MQYQNGAYLLNSPSRLPAINLLDFASLTHSLNDVRSLLWMKRMEAYVMGQEQYTCAQNGLREFSVLCNPNNDGLFITGRSTVQCQSALRAGELNTLQECLLIGRCSLFFDETPIFGRLLDSCSPGRLLHCFTFSWRFKVLIRLAFWPTIPKHSISLKTESTASTRQPNLTMKITNTHGLDSEKLKRFRQNVVYVFKCKSKFNICWKFKLK